LPGSIDGIQILERAKVIDPSVSIIVMTAFATVNSAVDAMKKGADDYLTKPFESEELVLVLRRAVRVRTLERENLELRERLSRHLQFQNLIGDSPRMQEIFKKLAIVAPTDETVIIFGETGTGKERIAGTIHENSPRRTGPGK
jgi:DNA-binding NtrC family response regulator